MVCLDIGPDLVEIAKARFRDQPNVTFVVTGFEEYDSAGHTFDLIIAGTSFHWIRPEARYVKTSALLKPDGALAVFANQHVGRDQGFFAEVQEIYRLHAPSLVVPAAARDTPDGPIPGTDLYEPPIVRRVPWSQEYTAEQYVRLLGTYSDHIALPDDRRRRLLREIGRLIETRYDGKVVKRYETVLDLRKKRRA